MKKPTTKITGKPAAAQTVDHGPKPFIINMTKATRQNGAFRTTPWTGSFLQLTLMCIPAGGEIGLECHANLDQFICIEQGTGLVQMGSRKTNLSFQKTVGCDHAFLIPAGTWHNLINTGKQPLKVYSIYSPPQHPKGTVHLTKADADAAEDH